MADFADVQGDDSLAAALRATGAALEDEFRAAMGDTARMIARDAQGRVPRLTGAARATIDVQVAEGAAMIVAGGQRAPYFGWLEHGGAVGRHDSIRLPYVNDGRYIGRAVDTAIADIETAALTAVRNAGRKGGLDVT